MKKICIVLIIFLFLFIFSSCQCNHTFSSKITREPTCADGEKTYYCTKCGYSYTERIPAVEKHQFEKTVIVEPTAERTGKVSYRCKKCFYYYTETVDKLCWYLSYWKDDYGDYTSDSVATATFKGHFSNTATNYSNLTVQVYVDSSRNHKVALTLYEYDSSAVSYSDYEKFFIKITFEDGKSEEYRLSGYNKYFYCDKLLDYILNNDTLECKIIEKWSDGNVMSTYYFTIKNDGLKEIYNKT